MYRNAMKCDEMKSYQEYVLVIIFVSFSTNLHWKYLYFPKSKILHYNWSLGMFLIYASVFLTCNNNSRFVTTSFENRKWSWFSCQIILEDFEWFEAEIERNEMKRNEMKWNEQMNPRRKICLLLNHIFEKIYF